MTDNSEYKEILEQNVSEAKKDIRDMDNPDYTALLEIEKNNKDRKTIKEFLENKADSQEVELDESEEEVVEEIEEETEGELLGSFSRQSLVTGGLLFGILVGLVAGLGVSSYQTGDVQVAKDTVTSLLDASGFEGDVTFSQATERNGLYYVTVNMTSTDGNQTSSSSRSFYVTKDGELLFPEVQSPFITSPIRVDETIQRLRQQQQQTGNQTGTTNGTAR